jgi:hypothetical protein
MTTHEFPKGGRFLLKYSKSGGFLGFVRVVHKRDGRGRPVKTLPFARQREAQEDTAGRTFSAPPSAKPALGQTASAVACNSAPARMTDLGHLRPSRTSRGGSVCLR